MYDFEAIGKLIGNIGCETDDHAEYGSNLDHGTGTVPLNPAGLYQHQPDPSVLGDPHSLANHQAQIARFVAAHRFLTGGSSQQRDHAG